MWDRLGGMFKRHPERRGGFEGCFAAQHLKQDHT
jgi:hypothetical protein